MIDINGNVTSTNISSGITINWSGLDNILQGLQPKVTGWYDINKKPDGSYSDVIVATKDDVVYIFPHKSELDDTNIDEYKNFLGWDIYMHVDVVFDKTTPNITITRRPNSKYIIIDRTYMHYESIEPRYFYPSDDNYFDIKEKYFGGYLGFNIQSYLFGFIESINVAWIIPQGTLYFRYKENMNSKTIILYNIKKVGEK